MREPSSGSTVCVMEGPTEFRYRDHRGEGDVVRGLLGRDVRKPIPSGAEHGPNPDGFYGSSPTISTRWPDPGEQLPRIDTQLFGILDKGNRGLLQPEQSFNARTTRAGSPRWTGSWPTTSACSARCSAAGTRARRTAPATPREAVTAQPRWPVHDS